MYSRFNLYQSHLDFAHFIWKQQLNPGDVVVDATCGNGHDTLWLATHVLTSVSGRVYAYDIQAQAMEKTSQLLTQELPSEMRPRVILEQRSHEIFPEELTALKPKLFVYNLGYLPGSDKSTTTQEQTTQQSLTRACELVAPGGLISVTCYSGHPEGTQEVAMLTSWCGQLSPKQWSCSWMHWVNRRVAPSLLLIQKAF